MKIEALEWPCGCRAVPCVSDSSGVAFFTQWNLHHCPLHGAAGELRDACRDLLDAFWDMSPLEYAKSRGLDGMSDHEGERIKERVQAALAKAEPKPATEVLDDV